MHKKQSQVIREQRNISKYTGLLCGRIMLMVCFFVLFIILQPTAFYFLVFLLFCPWILSHFFEKKQKAPELLLNSCAKKYFYTPNSLAVEKIIGTCIVLLLSFWQLLLAPKESMFILLRLAPGLLLLFYLVCRILTTAIVRQRIHRSYMELTLLD